MTEQNRAIEKALSKIISDEAAKEVANLEGQSLVRAFDLVHEQVHYHGLAENEPTVKSVVQSLYELATTCNLYDYDVDTIKDLFYSEIDILAYLLGIDLGKSNESK